MLISCTKFNVVVGITVRDACDAAATPPASTSSQSLAQRCEVDASPVSELLHFYREETTPIAIPEPSKAHRQAI